MAGERKGTLAQDIENKMNYANRTQCHVTPEASIVLAQPPLPSHGVLQAFWSFNELRSQNTPSA